MTPEQLKLICGTAREIDYGGIDVLALAELLGHSSPKMVMKYRHVGNHQYAGLVEQMASAVFQKRGE
jgi:hypothetical protein